MEDLFRIESPIVTVSWQTLSPRPPTIGAARVLPVSVTPAVCKVHYSQVRPLQLFEQSDYRLVVRSQLAGSKVAIRHRDPDLLRGVLPADESSPDVVVGIINFRNQVGRSRFDVLVDGRQELSFEVEVFPAKLDYREDYEQILAEVQNLLKALAFEFLKATHTSAENRDEPPTELEWALQLRGVIDELERGLRHVARNPTRGLRREVRAVRAERIRRPDAAILRAARIGAGQGGWIPLDGGSQIRARLPTRWAEPTLDTQEHRWFSEHVSRARRQLARLVVEARSKSRGARHESALAELGHIEARLDGLLQLEPLKAATEAPSVGFMSLQLLGAPGYREAARALITLQLGLRLEGNALELSLKDISTLYEYWCYLAVRDIVARCTGSRVDKQELVRVSGAGLQVLLKKGKSSASRFSLDDGRHVQVEYNPKYDSHVLLSQQPDIVIAVEEQGRPTVRVVLDAKYRVDASDENRQKLGIVGPPADALNVLHRYRDAILTEEPSPNDGNRVARSVVYAAALYPAVVNAADFEHSRLARQLRTFGVGAIPFLPSNRHLVTRWLDDLLKLDGWSICHGAQSSAADPWVWRAASEVVLVGVLRSARQEPAREHLEWCLQQSAYYVLERNTRHGRQMTASYVALYIPASLADDGVGAVTWIGKVSDSSIVARGDVGTSWPAQRPDDVVRLYHVDAWKQLERPIRNVGGHRFSEPRWSTRLAVQRASRLEELSLESPLEWSLFDSLTAERFVFDVRAGEIRGVAGGLSPGRARFIVGPTTITYAGANGFELARFGIRPITKPTIHLVVEHLRRTILREQTSAEPSE